MENLITPNAPWSWTDFAITLFFLSLIIFVRYFAMSAAVFWALWQRKSNWADARKLQKASATPGAIRKTVTTEIKYSVYSTAVFALPAAFMLEGLKRGWTQIYVSENPLWAWLHPVKSAGTYKITLGGDSLGGVNGGETLAQGIVAASAVLATPLWFEAIYILASVMLFLFLHDTFYYWFHRWMHRPGIYQVWHQAHHYSTNPTPWASFAFHPYEALIAGLIVPALTFVIPIHLGALLFMLSLMTITAVINHCGFEVFPRSWIASSWFGGWFITATHHNHHHTKFTKNYGLYFRWWDKWMGTDVL